MPNTLVAQLSEQSKLKVSERVSYKGRIVEVVETDVEIESGHHKTFEMARRAPGVRLILPNPAGSLLLTSEYRHELGRHDFRLPGGKVFDSLDEYNDFLETGQVIVIPATKKAYEEALEEAGAKIETLGYVHTSVCGATME